jgi:LuxR family maltose regulon positive regulatory protein
MPTAPPALLATKLQPPPTRRQTVERGRLLERLRPEPGTKLVVVAAPAGYGKTTLLGSWRDAEAAGRRPVAWLTLDERDNDPLVLWSDVFAALRLVCPDVGASLPETAGSSRLHDEVLPQLVNVLAEHEGVALLLDDFHRLSSGPARDSVAWLVERAPTTFLLMLASRSEPALPLGAMRAHGDLLELRAADLAFTSEEADALLNGRLGLGISLDDVNELVDRTEGWPAGVYLAALSLAGVEDRHAFVGRFGGTSCHVVDFLVDEVLDAHDAATQSLMLRSSILDRLCEPLCDAVLEQEGTGGRLRALARTNLFLVPLDDRGEWFRFHHLFGQLLRVELEHREPGLAPVLHGRAFAWHRDHGAVDAAIEHALEAGLYADAGELIATSWIEYADVRRHATVLAWLERCPRELVEADQQLLLVEAWLESLCGRREAASRAIEAVENLGQLDAGPLRDGFSSLEASIATLKAAIPWGDFGAALEHGRRAAELEGPGSRSRATICAALGLALFFSGELAEADRWLAEAAELAPAHGQWIGAADALAYRSRVAGEQGRVDDQAELADRAAGLARERGLEGIDGEVLVALGVSLEARERGHEALRILERAIALLRANRYRGVLADALIRRARLLQRMGRGHDASVAMREAREEVDACPDPRTLADRLGALERSMQTPRRSGNGALSPRELVILRMLRGSLSERDIGRELYLSHNTIHSHTRSIYRKLGVSSRGGALGRARELGLV